MASRATIDGRPSAGWCLPSEMSGTAMSMDPLQGDSRSIRRFCMEAVPRRGISFGSHRTELEQLGISLRIIFQCPITLAQRA